MAVTHVGITTDVLQGFTNYEKARPVNAESHKSLLTHAGSLNSNNFIFVMGKCSEVYFTTDTVHAAVSIELQTD